MRAAAWVSAPWRSQPLRKAARRTWTQSEAITKVENSFPSRVASLKFVLIPASFGVTRSWISCTLILVRWRVTEKISSLSRPVHMTPKASFQPRRAITSPGSTTSSLSMETCPVFESWAASYLLVFFRVFKTTLSTGSSGQRSHFWRRLARWQGALWRLLKQKPCVP